jgi:hypothetical protein
MSTSWDDRHHVRHAQQGQPVQRVVIPRVSCPRCHQDAILALPDGVTPRPYLRSAVEGGPSWSEIVPVRVNCEE